MEEWIEPDHRESVKPSGLRELNRAESLGGSNPDQVPGRRSANERSGIAAFEHEPSYLTRRSERRSVRSPACSALSAETLRSSVPGRA
jgi:hypothetical protein